MAARTTDQDRDGHVGPEPALDAADTRNAAWVERSDSFFRLLKAGCPHDARDLAVEAVAQAPEGSAIAASWMANLGDCYRRLRDAPHAIEQFQRAVATFEVLGDLPGQAIGHKCLGKCQQSFGDVRVAIEEYQRALAIHQQLGSRYGRADQLDSLGSCYRKLGDLHAAIEHHQRALVLYEQVDSLFGQASQHNRLGCCLQALGNLPAAIEHHQRALVLFEQDGSLLGQARVLASLGFIFADRARAHDALTRAAELYRRLGAKKYAGSLSRVLAGLEGLA